MSEKLSKTDYLKTNEKYNTKYKNIDKRQFER